VQARVAPVLAGVDDDRQALAGRTARERGLLPRRDARLRTQRGRLHVAVAAKLQPSADEGGEVGARGAQAQGQDGASAVRKGGDETIGQLDDVVVGEVLRAEGRRHLDPAAGQGLRQLVVEEAGQGGPAGSHRRTIDVTVAQPGLEELDLGRAPGATPPAEARLPARAVAAPRVQHPLQGARQRAHARQYRRRREVVALSGHVIVHGVGRGARKHEGVERDLLPLPVFDRLSQARQLVAEAAAHVPDRREDVETPGVSRVEARLGLQWRGRQRSKLALCGRGRGPGRTVQAHHGYPFPGRHQAVLSSGFDTTHRPFFASRDR